jgi:type IV pilus assembly protein PilV
MNRLTLLSEHRQQGFSLVEILVTFVILSIGILQVAALHATGLKNNYSAYLRSQTTLLAYSAIDLMRANRDQARSGAYDIAFAASASGSSMAATDLSTWKQTLSSVLPSGDGAIDCTSSAGTCVVVIQWDDSQGAGGKSNQQFSVATRI